MRSSLSTTAAVVGLLTTRDLRFADQSKTVSDRMTPRERLVVREGRLDTAAAEEVMRISSRSFRS